MIFGRAVNKYYLKYLPVIILGIITIIVVDYVQLEIPFLVGQIFDGLNGFIYDNTPFTHFQMMEIIKWIAINVSIIAVGRFLWRHFLMGTSRRIDYGLREDLYAHLSTLDQSFYSTHKTGGLMAYFANDIEAIRRSIAFGMIVFIEITFLGTLVIVRMTSISLTLTLFTAIPLAIITFVSAMLSQKMRRKFKASQKAFEDLSDFTNESLSGINVIKAFVKEELEIERFSAKNQMTKDKNIEYVKIQQQLEVLVRAIIGIIYTIIIGFGGYLIQTSDTAITLGDLTAFFMLFSTLIWPMRAVAVMVNLLSRGYGSLSRLNQILDVKPIVVDPDNPEDIHHLDGEIVFDHVTFAYPDGTEPVLKDVSFKIEKGSRVGILGRTGSGKTSIVDLLLRVYNVEEDSIFIDGYDIMNLPLYLVRDMIAYVPQDGFLFSDSISNNISFAKGVEYNNIEDVMSAAKLSSVHGNIVEFKDGYSTVVGERGVTLSGGQKQRVSIARALIKNAPILIMDDSVSAVDTQTEKEILENLNHLRDDLTTIIIAHRVSTMKNVDQIIIVDEGKILATGTHQSLLETCEYYQDLVERQTLEEEIGDYHE